jgi:DNA-binding CsgD family transcriptional regulator
MLATLGGRLTLHGREIELAVIAEMLEAAAITGAASLFVGEPGVGKTALLDAAAAEAADAGHLVIRVGGAEFEADIGYSVLIQAQLALEPYVDGLAPFHRRALSIATGCEDGDPPERLVVSAAVLRLLQLASEEQPVLLVVDDLQWVDRASAEVIFFIARRVHGSRLGVLAAARTDSSVLLGHVNLDEYELHPLDDEASNNLLQERFPMLGPNVRQRLLSEAQGNPLALLELPPALTGRARIAREAMPATLPLSQRLQSVFAGRIEALPAPTRDELLLASLDATGDFDVLRRAADDPTLSHLHPAEDAGLVALSDRLSFRHPLTKSAVVALATGAQVRDAHRRLGDALAADPDRQAWHLSEATIGPDERVAELVERAVRRGVARGDRSAAARLLRAADLSSDPRERSRRVTEAAYLGAFRSTTADAASQLLGRLQDLPPSSDEALYAVAGAAYVMLVGDGDGRAAFRILRDAIAAVEPRDVASTPALLAALDIMGYICQLLARTEYSDEFGRLLEHLGPAVPERFGLWVAAVLDPARTVLDVIDRIDAAIAAVDTADDEDVVRVAAMAIYTDRLAGVRNPLDRIASYTGGAGVTYASGARVLLWLADFLAGDWDNANATARAARRLGTEQGTMLWDPYFDYLTGMMAASTGDDVGVKRSTDALLETANAHDARLWQLLARQVLVHAAAGRPDFDMVYRHASAISPAGTLAEQTATALWVIFDLVESAIHTGRLAEARRHVAAVQELRIDKISPRLALLVTAARALTAPDRDTADDLFRRALGADDIDQWPYDVARVRLSYGEYLRSTRAEAEAREQLGLARATFDRLRARPWVSRVDAELAKLTEEPAVDTAGLTEKEYEVAQLAARGLTNKQIGAELYLSPRTVSTYLYRAYPKLGISTRAALRDALTGRASNDDRSLHAGR